MQVDRLRQKGDRRAQALTPARHQPESVPDWLALVGDAADGIPGSTASARRPPPPSLREFGHLEHIPARAADWKAEVVAPIASRRRSSREEQRSSTASSPCSSTDVPLRETLADLEWKACPGKLSSRGARAWACATFRTDRCGSRDARYSCGEGSSLFVGAAASSLGVGGLEPLASSTTSSSMMMPPRTKSRNSSRKCRSTPSSSTPSPAGRPVRCTTLASSRKVTARRVRHVDDDACPRGHLELGRHEHAAGRDVA